MTMMYIQVEGDTDEELLVNEYFLEEQEDLNNVRKIVKLFKKSAVKTCLLQKYVKMESYVGFSNLVEQYRSNDRALSFVEILYFLFNFIIWYLLKKCLRDPTEKIIRKAIKRFEFACYVSTYRKFKI